MRKRATHRRLPARAPTLVKLYADPTLAAREHMALTLLQSGAASGGQFNILLDCADLLLLAAHEKRAADVLAIAHLGRAALANVQERFAARGKLGATGEELKALRVLLDVSEDFWKRQSGALFAEALEALAKYRRHQANANKPTTA